MLRRKALRFLVRASWIASIACLWGCGDDGSGGAETGSADTSVSSATTCAETACPTTGISTTSTDPTTTTGSAEAEAETASADATTSTTGGETRGPMVLYVAGGERVSVWDIADDGTLTERSAVELGATVGPLAVDPLGGHLYAAVLPEQSIHAFAIEAATGDLTEIDTLEVSHTPVYLTTDRSGAHLLTAGFSEDILEVYPIAADGTLGDVATQTQTTAARPHLVLVDPSNEHVFVPARDADVVEHYLFDADQGTLSVADPPSLDVPEGTGPRHLVLAPDGEQAFLAGEFNSTLNVLEYDARTGMMTFVEALSTLPEGFEGQNTVADIHITPDGRSIYVSNRGHDSLAVFGRDANGIEPRGHVPTQARPREFEVTPEGRFLYAAGQDTGVLASYEIAGDGSLTAGPTYEVGNDPRWVLALDLPPP